MNGFPTFKILPEKTLKIQVYRTAHLVISSQWLYVEFVKHLNKSDNFEITHHNLKDSGFYLNIQKTRNLSGDLSYHKVLLYLALLVLR